MNLERIGRHATWTARSQLWRSITIAQIVLCYLPEIPLEFTPIQEVLSGSEPKPIGLFPLLGCNRTRGHSPILQKSELTGLSIVYYFCKCATTPSNQFSSVVVEEQSETGFKRCLNGKTVKWWKLADGWAGCYWKLLKTRRGPIYHLLWKMETKMSWRRSIRKQTKLMRLVFLAETKNDNCWSKTIRGLRAEVTCLNAVRLICGIHLPQIITRAAKNIQTWTPKMQFVVYCPPVFVSDIFVEFYIGFWASNKLVLNPVCGLSICCP